MFLSRISEGGDLSSLNNDNLKIFWSETRKEDCILSEDSVRRFILPKEKYQKIGRKL